MASFSGLGIGLTLVFGCLLLALVAKLYYSLWRRKRNVDGVTEEEDDDCKTSYAEQFLRLIFPKKPSCLQSINGTQVLLRGPEANGQEPDLELRTTQDLLIKACSSEESVEAELMRLHNLVGWPRFLSTIKEETKEDLESEDGKPWGDWGRKGSRASLRDLMVTVDTPSLTPLASPRSKSHPLTVLDSYNQIGLNPQYEASTEAELNRLRSSPPPKFKFLKDAEEKLLKRLMEEAEKRTTKYKLPVQASEIKIPDPAKVTEDKDGYIFGVILGKNKESELLHHLPQYPPASPHVLPLASSPTTFRPLEQRSILPQILLSSK